MCVFMGKVDWYVGVYGNMWVFSRGLRGDKNGKGEKRRGVKV